LRRHQEDLFCYTTSNPAFSSITFGTRVAGPADANEAIRAFARLGKLWKIHFRNVSAPVPHFVETFVDDGYTDMKKVMRTLVEVDFRGILIADHVPQMVGDRRTGWAYSIGYIKALYDMARDERSNR